MARSYNVWLLKNNSQAYLDSGTRMIHDGGGHNLYRYENGKLLELSGDDVLVVKADGRIVDKTGNQAGFVTDYAAFTEEIQNLKTRTAGTAGTGTQPEEKKTESAKPAAAAEPRPDSQQSEKGKKKPHIWRYVLVVIGIIFLLNQNNSGSRDSRNQAAKSTSSLLSDVVSGEKKTSAPTKAPTASPTAVPTAAVPTAAARLERNWQSMITFPTASEIDRYNSTAVNRSPYLQAWMQTGSKTFTGYSVNFRAEFQPNGTYCCLGNFDLDYSALKKTYKSYRTEYNGVAGYAGLQRLSNGELKSILSFWDVFCTDKSGKTKTIRAQLVYPSSTDNDSFSGEGTGTHCLADYPWKPGRWYQMQLLCGRSDTTGNTTVEQWVQDLSTSVWTKLCVYDLGVPNVSFKGNVCVFLENFDPKYAGAIRSMECRNFAVCRNKKWTGVTSGVVEKDIRMPYTGSYAYKVSGDTLCMITTGVTGKAREAKQMSFKLK